jgi:type IV secretory pathway VirB10-like protein
MDWIFDNFQILALVGIAFASWLKTRADARAAKREEEEARRELEEGETFGPEQEWNEPQEWTPPPAPPPQVVKPPPLPTAAQQAADELKHQLQLQERLRQLRETKAMTSGGVAAKRARATTKKTAPTEAAVPASLRGVLRKRSEIRRAVILREVLGPPLGLR